MNKSCTIMEEKADGRLSAIGCGPVVGSPRRMKSAGRLSKILQTWRQNSPRSSEGVLLLAAMFLLSAHYVFGEWVWHPQIKLWEEAAFWKDLPGYTGTPLVLWGAWGMLSAGRLKMAYPLFKMSFAVCVGDLFFWLVAHNLTALEKKIPVEYWYAWTFWLPLVLVLGNGIALPQWWRVTGAKFPYIRRRRETVRPAMAGWKRVSVGVLGIGLAGGVFLTVVLPQLEANALTLDLASTVLIPPRLLDDFNHVIDGGVCNGKRLGAILDHVKLADRQRHHFYTNLDARVFQEFVLSPTVEILPLSDIGWRRALWAYFSPCIRQEHDAMKGAQKVVDALRERVGISPQYPYLVGPETIWIQGMTDKKGFERIYVAALRSVGLAARLTPEGQTKVWTGTDWQAAPRPLQVFEEKAESPTVKNNRI